MPPSAAPSPLRDLVIVLGDQLDPTSAALDGFDAAHDAIWMAEVAEESTHVWSSKPRIALFLAAMRHFRDAQRALGRVVRYTALDGAPTAETLEDRADSPARSGMLADMLADTLAGALVRAISESRPERLVMTEAGDWRVLNAIESVARDAGVPLEVRTDRHFLSTQAEFDAHADGRKQLRLEYWYRELRRKHGILLDASGGPEGGEWNYDAENRRAFGKAGPPPHEPPVAFPPDAITREVLALVNARFASHPGDLTAFDWPVTPADAMRALDDFITHRLPRFGEFQDAMWHDEPWLHHSRLAAAMNLKLLDPRAVIAATEQSYRAGRVPLAAAEGFIRQILGWREYVRGIYWRFMPEYVERNALDAQEALPAFYWDGDTEMACLRDAIGQTLRLGYAHHIQRLMVTGLYAMMLGVHPRRVHEWYLAVYVDAVEWVELPNTLGMSQYGDGGVMASKPYAATGKYIQRMSDHCTRCRFDPAKSVGEDACPYTTLYWDFLMRHESRLRGNQRMALQVRNLERIGETERAAIRARASEIRTAGGAPPRAFTLL